MLGTLELIAQSDALPPLAELSPGTCHIGWTGTLRLPGREDVERVFAFVTDKRELQIVDLNLPDGATLMAPWRCRPDRDPQFGIRTRTRTRTRAGARARARS